MTRIFVTGASGFVGRAFVESLGTAGDAVEVVAFGRRRPEGHAAWVQGDLADPGTLTGLKGSTTVVHIAAEKRDEATMAAVNVDGTRALVRAAFDAGVERFVLLSSVGVYGARPGSGRVREGAPHTPANEYERTKDIAERETIEFCRARGMQCVVLQPSNVIGQHTDGVYPLLTLMRAVQRGRFVRLSDAAWANYVAVTDVARALTAATSDARADGTFIVNEPMRLDALVDLIANAVGACPPRRAIPAVVGRAAGAVGSITGRVLGRTLPINRERVRDLMNTTWYDASTLADTLGVRCRGGVARTVAELAASYRSAGLL